MTTRAINVLRRAEAPTSVAALFHESEQRVFRRTDKLFLILMGLQWIAGIVFALIVSPRAWAGATSSIHVHVYAAIFLGGLCCLVPMLFCWKAPGHVLTRHAVAIGQTGFSSLLIHLTGGRIETHFHVFGSLAFLACYRDWRVLITATIIVAGDHLVRGIWYPMSVYGVLFASPWRVVEHALWVVFEDVILIWSCRVSRDDMFAICEKEHQNRQLLAGLEQNVEARTAELQAEVIERRRAESTVRANEERYRTLVENSPQIILKVDRDDTIQFINRTVEGMHRDQVIGQSFFKFHPTEAHEPMRDALNGVFQFGQRRNLEILGPGPSGTSAWYSMNLAPLHTDGKVTSAIVLATDVTERHETEQELIKARDLAEAGNRAKSEFLATMSHELRTPMNGVIGFVNLLMDTPLNNDQKEFAQTIRASSESLLAIINDILDLSKIESGKLDLNLAVTNAREIVEEVGEMMLPRAESKNLELSIWFDPAAPSFIETDPGRFRQVLLNLVANAIKFTDSGHVLIEVVNCADASKPSIRVGVRDTGMGIPREKHSLLFQKFSQVDGSSTRKFGGTGLGLAICKQLVEFLGGEVGVESAPGHGSHFWFTHPATAVQPEMAAAVRSEAPAALDGLRILVIDDLEINRRVLQEQLRRWGIRHEAASSGPLALELLRQGASSNAPFQIALVDHLMPVMDGVMFAERVKTDPAIAQTGLIMLTSGSQRSDARKMLERGFAGFLCKPVVRPSQLLDAIQKVWSSLNRGLSAPTPVKTAVAPSNVDSAVFSVLLAEDNPVNQRVAALNLKKLGCRVEIAPNGRVAVDLFRKGGFDCIFMDVLMPEMDGYEATGAIRGLEKEGIRIPIIALTANAMPGDRERCLAAGMDDYVAKPVKVDELKRAVKTWLASRRQDAALVS
jgi:two-component system sensor histidine kinase/response regulator